VQDRVIVVTGAGGGLGREYALTLAREGAGVESYLDELAERRPFKATEGGG